METLGPPNPPRENYLENNLEKLSEYTKIQSIILQNDLDEDTSPELKEAITTIKASGKEIFFIYRSDTIYDQLAPYVMKTLATHQIPVTCKIFLKETDKQEIKQWTADNRNAYAGKIFVGDRACRYGYNHEHKERNAFGSCDADWICEKSIEKYYQKKFADHAEGDKTDFENLFIHLVQQCLSHEQPEDIVLMKAGIASNAAGTALGYPMTEEMTEAYKNDRSKYNTLQNDRQNNVVKKFEELLKKAGYQGEIRTYYGGDNYLVDGKHVWHICDKNMPSHDFFRQFKQNIHRMGRMFILPLSSFLACMKEYDFLTDLPPSADITTSILLDIAKGLKHIIS